MLCRVFFCRFKPLWCGVNTGLKYQIKAFIPQCYPRILQTNIPNPRTKALRKARAKTRTSHHPTAKSTQKATHLKPKQETSPTPRKEKSAVLAKDLPIANPGRVILHNDIYKVDLGRLGAWENNLLFAIFNKLKDNGDMLVHFSPQEIKEMIGDIDIGNKNLVRVVKALWNKVRATNFWVLPPRRDENHMLFRTFAINYYDGAKSNRRTKSKRKTTRNLSKPKSPITTSKNAKL